MSSYLNFYVRGANESENQNHYLCSYSRSSKIYEIFHAPYGGLAELTADLLREYISDVREAIAAAKRRREFFEKEAAALYEMNAPLSERMELWTDIQYSIDQVEDELEELRFAKSFGEVLIEMVEWQSENKYFYGIDC